MRRAAVAFRRAEDFRAWLDRRGASTAELFVRCYKTSAADRGMTYKQGSDEALCFGWIDGVRHAIDAVSFSVRFTPRRKGSTWSAVNIRRLEALEAAGRVRPPDRAAVLPAHERVLGPEREAGGDAPEAPRDPDRLLREGRADPAPRPQATARCEPACGPSRARRVACLQPNGPAGCKIGRNPASRTPPLWGVRTRDRLMHDGESLTFTGAILRHGARARGVTARFNRLASRGRSQLLAFLRSL